MSDIGQIMLSKWTRIRLVFSEMVQMVSSLETHRVPGTFRLPARVIFDQASCTDVLPIAADVGPVSTRLPSVGGPATEEESDRHVLTTYNCTWVSCRYPAFQMNCTFDSDSPDKGQELKTHRNDQCEHCQCW